MKISHSFILVAVLAGAAASASPAQADTITREGNDCVPALPEYEDLVDTDFDGIHTVSDHFAYVLCFHNEKMNVSRVDVQVRPTGERIICAIKGTREENNKRVTSFGPFVALSDGGGIQTIGVDVPDNDTELVVVECYLPAVSDQGAPYLMSYTMNTR